jgi:L,D-transpeptidase YbiS
MIPEAHPTMTQMRILKLCPILICLLASALPLKAQQPESRSLRAEQKRLLDLLGVVAKTPYIVIDTQDNQLTLRDIDHQALRTARCATGAGRRLEGRDPRKKRQTWEFSTPTGRFSVLRKVVDPIWIKPEWAFVETNQEIPIFAEDRRRFQRGVLGEFALYFAREYMIHGTLFEINLGKSITHGCVRVDSQDLAYLHSAVGLGWPVLIY